MKFVVDESTGQSVVNELRRLGHDVLAIRESYPSIDDPPILNIAVSEKRIVLTNDKDFGELVYRSGLPRAGILSFPMHSIRLFEKFNPFAKFVLIYSQENVVCKFKAVG
jgi:uncharacterized protein with PIN domain